MNDNSKIEISKKDLITIYDTAAKVSSVEAAVLRHSDDRKNENKIILNKFDLIFKKVDDLSDKISKVRIEGLEKNYKLYVKIAVLTCALSFLVSKASGLIKISGF